MQAEDILSILCGLRASVPSIPLERVGDRIGDAVVSPLRPIA